MSGAAIGDAARLWLYALSGIWLLAVLDQILAARAAGGMEAGTLGRPWRAALRALFKERRRLRGSDGLLCRFCPTLLLVLAAALTALAADPPAAPGSLVAVAGLYVLVGVLDFALGWAAGSGYALLGAGRALALLLAVLAPLLLALGGVSVANAELGLAGQTGHPLALTQPLGAVCFTLSAMILSGWGPVRGPRGTDLAGGIELALTGVPLLIWRLARYLLLLATALLTAGLYFAAGPWLPAGGLLGAALLLALSHRLPLLEPRAFLSRAWLVLLPLAVINLGWALLLGAGPGAG